MQKILSVSLLQQLTARGYRYFLSRTTAICGEGADTCITLKPIKYRPALTRLPKQYDTYFNMKNEPVLMAQGIDETIVLVDMSSIV